MRRLAALPLWQKLLWSQLPIGLIASVLVLLGVISLDVLSGARAYVGGEGLWSKAQKDAVYHLHRYARSADPAEFTAYENALAVPLGDRRAREALDRPAPDLAAARAGFAVGRNHPDDVDAMIQLFLRFRKVSYVDQAIAIWAEADTLVARLTTHAATLRAQVNATPRDPAAIAATLNAIDATSAQLAPLEDRFSYILGEASRVTKNLLITILAGAALLMMLASALVYWPTLQQAAAADAERADAEERMRLVTNGVPALIAYVDREERYQFANQTYWVWFGLTPERMIGRTIKEVFGGAVYAQLQPRIARALQGERVDFEYRVAAQTPARYIRAAYVPHRDAGGTVAGFYLLANDVSDAEAAKVALAAQAERLAFMAHHDALTGLANRELFREQAPHMLARARRAGRRVALLFIDLDHFKAINDRFGHAAGDALLRGIANRLTANLRGEDLAARLAGDEFCVLVETAQDANEATQLADKLLPIIAAPVMHEGHALQVTASIGIALSGVEPEGIDGLLARADAAMYGAKADGRNTARQTAG